MEIDPPFRLITLELSPFSSNMSKEEQKPIIGFFILEKYLDLTTKMIADPVKKVSDFVTRTPSMPKIEEVSDESSSSEESD